MKKKGRGRKKRHLDGWLTQQEDQQEAKTVYDNKLLAKAKKNLIDLTQSKKE